MKLRITVLVFREGEKPKEADLLAEFPDAIAAIRAVAQLGTANSLLSAHPDVKSLLDGFDPNALMHIQESMGEGVVILIKDVAEHREVMPKDLRDSSNIQHLLGGRAADARKVPPEGIIQTLHDGQLH